MKYKINLIGKKSSGFFDKVLYFFLNYLRYILVITQLSVIGVLFFRFSIDQGIIDLKDSIDQKKEIINVVRPILAESEKIKKKEISIRKILASQDLFSNSLNYILSIFPQDVKLDDFTIGEDKMLLRGSTLNPQQLQAFHLRLKNEKKFKKITLSDIKRGEAGYTFSLSLENYLN